MARTIGRKILKAVEVVVALAALVLILMWMSNVFHVKVAPGKTQAELAALPAGAKTAEVRAEALPALEEAVGTVVAARRTAVSSKIMASIKEVRVRAGDTVSANDVVAVLDSRDLESRVQQAQQAERAAQAVLKQAESDFERKKSLYESRTIGKSDFDQSQSAFGVAKADAERAARAIDEAKIGLSYAEIKAPVAGRVVDRLAEPGDLATPGQPLLNIYDPSQLRLEAPVRESLATVLKVGDPIEVYVDATKATLQGTVQEIVPQAQAGARAFVVKVGLPPSEGIFSGMFGRLRIPVGLRSRLLVDARAVERIGQLEYAQVVVDDGRVERRLVTTGRPTGDGAVEVLSGLSEKDRVVLR